MDLDHHENHKKNVCTIFFILDAGIPQLVDLWFKQFG